MDRNPVDESRNWWASQCMSRGMLLKIGAKHYVCTGRSPAIVHVPCHRLKICILGYLEPYTQQNCKSTGRLWSSSTCPTTSAALCQQQQQMKPASPASRSSTRLPRIPCSRTNRPKPSDCNRRRPSTYLHELHIQELI